MNPISRKLRSESGASMLIALLFLMVCLFIGGSVLTAASANGAREARASDPRDFLSLCSAARLLADEIDGDKAVTLALTVEDLVFTQSGGNRWVITFRAPFTGESSMTGIQRLLYETAVCRYLLEKNIIVEEMDVQVELEGFWYLGESILNLKDFWYPYFPGEPRVAGELDLRAGVDADGEVLDEVKARFLTGSGENPFDFIVTIGDAAMTIAADASVSTTQIPHPAESLTQENGEAVEVMIAETRTYITWDWAHIRKGGEDR